MLYCTMLDYAMLCFAILYYSHPPTPAARASIQPSVVSISWSADQGGIAIEVCVFASRKHVRFDVLQQGIRQGCCANSNAKGMFQRQERRLGDLMIGSPLSDPPSGLWGTVMNGSEGGTIRLETLIELKVLNSSCSSLSSC